MPTNTINALRASLDRDGCAFGQVSRERVDNLAQDIKSIESKVSFVAGSVVLQLVSFVLAVMVFLLNHAK
jgi:hypothetical protein